MKILVITPCTAKKIHKPSNQLQQKDFNPPGWLNRRTRELERYETPAAEMYTGDGHRRLMNGVKNLQRTFGRGIVDVRIISPGYGLLGEETRIVPYEYTFKGQNQEEIWKRSRKLGIHEEIKRLLPSYDLAFFLLSDDYVTACLLPFRVPNSTQIFLVAPGLAPAILANGLYSHAVCTGAELVKQLEGATPRYLKEIVFERLCKVACERGLEVFEEVKRNPQRIINMVLNCNRGR